MSGREILDAWDLKHFGRTPVADSSKQYQSREDLVAMIDEALSAAVPRSERASETVAASTENGSSDYPFPEYSLSVEVARRSKLKVDPLFADDLLSHEFIAGARWAWSLAMSKAERRMSK